MIYFKDGIKAKSTKELLKLGFSAFAYYNANMGSVCFFLPTFYDEGFLNPQCAKQARRSFYDLYEIVTTYFPSISKKKFAHILLSLEGISCFYCPTSRRLVFLSGPKKSSGKIFDTRMDKKYNKGYKDDTGVSFNYVVKLAKSYKK